MFLRLIIIFVLVLTSQRVNKKNTFSFWILGKGTNFGNPGWPKFVELTLAQS